MKNKIINYLINNWLFLCIFLIQLFVLIFSFGFFKQGYHSDELYEYGFANSYDTRVLDTDDDGNSLDRIWTDSNELWKYITVEDSHKFSYKNIYDHASMDYYNPPFKLFLLHTICSFFPGRFSKWYSFIINIFSFIILIFSMYHLLFKMLNSKPAALAGIILFGFSAGCFNSMMFLRMYMLGMAFGVLFLYVSYLLFCKESKNNILLYIFIFLSLFLGAFTLHLFLVFAFPLVLVICLGYLFTKRFKRMFAYGFTCLSSVLLSFLAFPDTFANTSPANETLTYALPGFSQKLQLRIYCYLITLDNFGFCSSVYSNPWIKNSLAIFLFLIIVFTPLFLFLRKEEWFKKFMRLIFDRIKYIMKKMNYSSVIIIACLTSIVFVIIICSYRTSVYNMSVDFASRYIFIVYPLVSIFAVSIVYYFLLFVIPKIKIVSLVIVILAFFISGYSQVLTSQSYLMMHNEEGITLHDLEDDANCLITLSTDWLIICFAPEIHNTNSYYFVNYIDYVMDENCFEGIDHNAPAYLLMDRSMVLTKEQMEIMKEDKESVFNIFLNDSAILDEDVLNFYSSQKGVKCIESVGMDYVFCRPIEIYKITFND